MHRETKNRKGEGMPAGVRGGGDAKRKKDAFVKTFREGALNDWGDQAGGGGGQFASR